MRVSTLFIDRLNEGDRVRENEPSDCHRLRGKRFHCRCFIRNDWSKAKKKRLGGWGWSYLNQDPNVISTNPTPIVSPQLNKEKLQLFPQVTRQAHSEVLFNYRATLFNSTRLLNSNDESRKVLVLFAVMSSPTFCAENSFFFFPRRIFSYSLCLTLFSSQLCNGSPEFPDPDTFAFLFE